MPSKPSPKAEAVFTAAQMRDETVKDMLAKERAAVDAKSAKLRALRLAKEAEDKAAGKPKAAAPAAPKKRVVAKVAGKVAAKKK